MSNKPGMGKLLDITKECPELTVKDNVTTMIEVRNRSIKSQTSLQTYGSLVAEPAGSTNIEKLLSEIYEKDAEKDSELVIL